MHSIFKTFFLSLCIVANTAFAYAQTAAILPPAKTTFFDQNGKPLTGGKVYFYIPGTTTQKTTWQDAAETIPNTNPVVLDAAGRAIVLGSGSYQQELRDKNGNLIWSQVTSSAGSGGGGGVTVGDGNAVGVILPWSGFVTPSNYAFSYGQELSRTTYANLFSNLTLSQSITCVSGNATLTNVSDTSQLNIGADVEASCLPSNSTIISKTSNTVTINNIAFVSTTTAAVFFPWGNGNGLTTFNTPDLRGVVLPGRNNMGGAASSNLANPAYTDPNSLGGIGGSQTKSLIASDLPAYTPIGIIANGAITFPSAKNTSTATGVAQAISTGPTNVNNDFTSILNPVQASSIFTGSPAPFGGIAASASISSGGSGYTNGTQLLTVTSGTCSQQPQFNVTVSGGIASAPALVTAGLCSVAPANPAPTSGGGGSGATLNVIYSANSFSLIQPSKTINYIIKVLPDVNLSIARCANLIDAGTACLANVGTSGATLGLLNTANVYSANQTFSSVAISSGTFTGLATPVNPTDAATKAYVDSVATGLNILPQTNLSTAAVLPNTPTYANGTLGVGATLTSATNTTLTVDGTAAPLTTVVLVKNQASAFQNGIYTVTQAGSGAAPWILTRATYFDQSTEMKVGSYTLVLSGTVNANSSWVLQTAVATVGTDPVNWVQFSGQAGVTSVGGNQGIVTNAQVTASCNIFTATLSGCIPSAAGSTTISQLNSSSQTWVTPLALTLSTRALALTLNLTGVTVLKTLGYSVAGDGGGATFQKIASGSALVDYSIASLTITGNGTSGCTNGTYRGQSISSVTGQGAIATVTVSGNVVSAINLTNYGGNKYLAGQSLSLTIPGCLAPATFSVASITTPTGSFVDSVGNLWQLVVDGGTYLSTKQFGAKVDGTTDDFIPTQNAVNFAGLAIGNSPDNGGTMGQTVLIPQGVTRLCGTGATSFVIPYGVWFRGQNAMATNVHVCNNINSSVDAFVMCDRLVQLACFGTLISDMTIFVEAGAPSANANVSVIFSNSIQQMDAVKRVSIFAKDRTCIHYDTGWGGAADVGFTELDCIISGPNPGFNFTNVGTTNVILTKTNVEGSLITANAYQITGGNFQLNSVHAEGISTGVFVNIPTTNGNGVVIINGFTGGSGCTNGIVRQTGSATSSVVISGAQPNGCTNTYSNGGTGSGSVVVAGQTVL